MDNEVGRSGVGESFLFFVESERKGDASAEPRVTHRVDSGGREDMVVKRKRGSLCEGAWRMFVEEFVENICESTSRCNERVEQLAMFSCCRRGKKVEYISS